MQRTIEERVCYLNTNNGVNSFMISLYESLGFHLSRQLNRYEYYEIHAAFEEGAAVYDEVGRLLR